MMSPTSITFTRGAFLVEVEPDFRETRPGPFVVHLSLLEEGGHVLRPLVARNGNRVVLHGRTELHALGATIRYLAQRFGELIGPSEVWRPNQMQWGQPLVVER